MDVDEVFDDFVIIDGDVFETTCSNLSSGDKLVFPSTPASYGMRFDVVEMEDEDECSATRVDCQRTAMMDPESTKASMDDRIVLANGTEWLVFGYVYERFETDVYICPARGKLLVDRDAVSVGRMR